MASTPRPTIQTTLAVTSTPRILPKNAAAEIGHRILIVNHWFDKYTEGTSDGDEVHEYDCVGWDPEYKWAKSLKRGIGAFKIQAVLADAKDPGHDVCLRDYAGFRHAFKKQEARDKVRAPFAFNH